MTATSRERVASRAIAGALLTAGLLAAVAVGRAAAASPVFVGQSIVEQSKDKSEGGLNKDWGSCAQGHCDYGK